VTVALATLAVVGSATAVGTSDVPFPPAGIPLYFDRYLNAVERLGLDPAAAAILTGDNAITSEGPERPLAQVGDRMLYQVNGSLETGG
jgi:hypothetical protein